SAAPAPTGPFTNDVGTKSIPVNDESAASRASGDVICCGGNFSTSLMGTSSFRIWARLAAVHRLGGLLGSGAQRILPGPAARIERRLAGRQEAVAVRPAVVVRSAVRVLLGQVQRIRRVVGRPRTPLVCAIFPYEQPAVQGVNRRGKPNGISVPVPPRDRLDRGLRTRHVEPRAPDGAGTDPRAGRAFGA